MSLKKWFYLFGTTLLIGGVASLITGLYLQFTDEALKLWDPSLLIFNFGIGLLFSVLSQMGFFAYLTLNYIARAMIKRRLIWMTIQWILIIVTFVDLIVLRVVFYEDSAGTGSYSVLPIALMVLSIVIALQKAKLTNSSAFTPALFFLFVVTSIEIIPALRMNNTDSTLIMLIPVYVCNIWQILKLHSLVAPPKES